jgi:hypothetical protein
MNTHSLTCAARWRSSLFPSGAACMCSGCVMGCSFPNGLIWCLHAQAIRSLDGAEWQGRRLGVERARNVK